MANTLSKESIDEVLQKIDEAAPHRAEIMETLNKQMKFLRQSFVAPFVQGFDKKKDKEAYVAEKIKYEKIFRTVKDYIHYKGGESINPKFDGLNKIDNLLSVVELLVQWLRYTGHSENLESCLAKHGMTITCKTLQDTDQMFMEPDLKDNLSKILASAVGVQEQICNEANEIKCVIFEELSDHIKYDGKTNKSGMKSGEFDRLTSLEVIKRKSEEAAENKLETVKDQTTNTIDSKLNVQTVAQAVVG